jgi:hypothetical protein
VRWRRRAAERANSQLGEQRSWSSEVEVELDEGTKACRLARKKAVVFRTERMGVAAAVGVGELGLRLAG